MILVVGEALVDVVEATDGTRVEHAGGSPANVAVGLGRAGLETTLAASIGTDDHAALIRSHLADAGVRLLPGLRAPERTATAVARLDADGSASYEFDLIWDPGPIRPPSAPDAVHTGSIAAVLEPGADDVEDLLRELAPCSVVTLDPNVRPGLIPDLDEARRRLESLLQLSDVVKVSDEDLAILYPDEDASAVVRRWLAAGPAAVAVTLGREGARIHSRFGAVRLPPRPVPVVDTVGAGDAFMSGLIAALDGEAVLGPDGGSALHEADPPFWRRVGTIASLSAEITVGRAGAQPPWREELGLSG